MKNKYTTTTIKKIERENKKVKTFILNTKIKAMPGQYVMVWIPGLHEKPFGVANPSPLTLSIAKVGPFSEKVHQLKVGDKVTFRGPYGSFFIPKGKKMVFVGGGYGVVPLYFLALNTPKNKRQSITVIIGAKTKEELCFVSRFKKLGCKVLLATDDGSAGFKGFTTDVFENLLKKEKLDSAYACGPEMMMKKIALVCNQKSIFCQVSIERHFKCGGIGLCGECGHKGFLVCKEGPVFNGKILLE